MWQILNVEPVYGVCSICRSHECGIVDGKHQWIHTEALDDTRENIVIGYKCVKLFAENLGISKQVVEKVVYVHPSTSHLLSEAFAKLKEYEESIKNDSAPVVVVPTVTGVHPTEQKVTPNHRSKATTKK